MLMFTLCLELMSSCEQAETEEWFDVSSKAGLDLMEQTLQVAGF